MKQKNTCTKTIQSVDRALEILDCFNGSARELSLSYISDCLSLNKATVFGLINTMITRGYMEKSPKTGMYRLGPSLLQKSALSMQTVNRAFYDIGNVHIRRISIKYHVNSYLYSYTNYVLSCVESFREDESVKGEITSHKMAYHAAASGKLVLAHFSEMQLEHYLASAPFTSFTEHTITEAPRLLEEIGRIRSESVSFECEEVEEGLHAYAVPLLDGDGNLIGTVSASGNVAHMLEIRSALLESLQTAAREICSRLI